MPNNDREPDPLPVTELPVPPGVRLKAALSTNVNEVLCLAFDRTGRILAVGGADGFVGLWDEKDYKRSRRLEMGNCKHFSVIFDPKDNTLVVGDISAVRHLDASSGTQLRWFETPDTGYVTEIALNPMGTLLAAGCHRKGIGLWDSRSGMIRHYLTGSDDFHASPKFHPNGELLAAGSISHGVALWDVQTGSRLRELESVGSGNGFQLAFDPAGSSVARGYVDGCVQIWDVGTGKSLRKLEGHTSAVDAIAFSPDGRLMASKSDDDTIRLWSCTTWQTVAVIPCPKRDPRDWVPALTFHPTKRLLATSGSEPGTHAGLRGTFVHLWELDYDVLFGRTALQQTVHHATAKVVLVGDSGVGKTGLGWRLAHGDYREHDSTHGQQFWLLRQLATTRADGTRCEAVLWDLAGQPDYRLIHALSVQDADLALVLFDPTNSRDPLGSAEYWLRQLPPGCPKILVAARVDRGAPVLTDAELDEFCRAQGVSGGWIATSAKAEVGLDELVARMTRAIRWDDKPAVSTDAVFKRIKDHVLALKETRATAQIVFTADELRTALPPAADAGPAPTEAQVLTAVRSLGSQGFVRLVALSSGEERVLLVPELLNNLAASVVLEARRNPRGLGAVEEEKLFGNGYRFPELEPLAAADRRLLLDGTVTAFLANRLSYRCFREAWGDMRLLVFPDLMNVRKPERELPTEDGPTYVLAGATENTFAGLVVLLGYTNLFLRTDQAHDVAWFESNHKDVCGVRQVRDDPDRALVLLFGSAVNAHVRAVFEGLVEQMLARREGGVRRIRPVKCAACGTAVDRAVMTRRMRQGKAAVGCEECSRPVPLPPDEPLGVKPAERATIAREGAVAERRTRFEEIIFQLLRLAEVEKRTPPTCFVSYAWGDPDQEQWVERRLAEDLDKAGIRVTLDRWDNAHPGASVSRFLDRIEKVDRVLVVGTTAYRRKYDNLDPHTGTVVAAEMEVISARLLGPEARRATVVPLLLEGTPDDALPPALRTRVRSDFRDDDRYFDTMLTLLTALYGIEPRHAAVANWRRKLAGDEYVAGRRVGGTG